MTIPAAAGQCRGEVAPPDATAPDATAINAINSSTLEQALSGDPQLDAVAKAEIAQPQTALAPVCVTLHAHFYQPPRENPYIDAIEQQLGAAPYHDWNERIYWESYRPNAFAQVVNDRGELVEIVNNYEYFSFNIGPTLMSWLERHGREVYERILEGDRKSRERLGYGNAIAQVYNHIIMPLANAADKRTQIRWGKADFRRHFGREPEGMWLAETAVDRATVEALIDEGLKFIVLAPSQAERCRPHLIQDDSGTQHSGAWQTVSDGNIDPTRPYRCWLGSRFLDIFFYDGPISAAIGFEDLLGSAYNLAERLQLATRSPDNPDNWGMTSEQNTGDLIDGYFSGSATPQLISVATDGETFGHHKMGTEKCAAYAFTREFPRRGWQVSNFAHYLHHQPPTWEVELKPVTAWSCSHGVDRWQEDCGCARSDQFHQRWRRPLRQALDWLRDQLIPVYVAEAGRLLRKPWQARDEYIELIVDRDPARVSAFLERHQCQELSPKGQVRALQLLEMERYTLLMYTSCGWFFEEISRPEGVQILRYAARALELAEQLTGLELESKFVERLALAPSNIEQFADGAAVYQQRVKPSQISPEQVAAHWIMLAMVRSPLNELLSELYGYRIERLEHQTRSMGTVSLRLEQLRLVSMATWETAEMTAIAFQSESDGYSDLHCRLFHTQQLDRAAHQQLKATLYQTFHQQPPAQFIESLARHCPVSQSFGLADLLPEVCWEIRQALMAPVLSHLDQIYNRIYREHGGLLQHYGQDYQLLPMELQAAAQITLNRRLNAAIAHLEQSLTSEPQSIWSGRELDVIHTLDAIAREAQQLNCAMDLSQVEQTVERMVVQLLGRILGPHGDVQQRTREIQLVIRLVLMARTSLKLDPNLMQAQERFWLAIHDQPLDQWRADFRALAQLLHVQVPEQFCASPS